MNTTTKKTGSGRTEGSFSFCKISLAELCAKFKPDMEIVMSAKQAKAMGFTDFVSGPAATMLGGSGTKKKIVAEPETPVSVNVIVSE